MDNLKKFATYNDYTAATLNYPAVSWIVSGNTVAFDPEAPVVFGGLTVYYDIEDISVESGLFNGGGDSSGSDSGSGSGGGGALPTRMIVDGVEEVVISTWRFETAGEHIVQYEFADNAVPQDFIKELSTVKEVVVGNDITSISYQAILGCASLTSATIGSGVTLIGSYVFYNCSSLTSVTVNAIDPPELYGANSFQNTNNCPIYVPAASVSAYQSATDWTSLASRIQAIQ